MHFEKKKVHIYFYNIYITLIEMVNDFNISI